MDAKSYYLDRVDMREQDDDEDDEDFCEGCGEELCRHGYCPNCTTGGEMCPVCNPDVDDDLEAVAA